MHDQHTNYAVAIPEGIHLKLLGHLVRQDEQEDLCFALWHPSQGATRVTGLLQDVVLPDRDDRRVHRNASFSSDYFVRALSIARERRMGFAFLHSHLGPGWQGLSRDDNRAESTHAGAVEAATGLPFLGLTLGNDGSWSARFWHRTGLRQYEPFWCGTVRVVGERLSLTFHPLNEPSPTYGDEMDRTIGVWGAEGQAILGRLRIGIIGLGSVGSIIADALARMGVTRLGLIDHDCIWRHNLDRTQHATFRDIGRYKVDLAAENAVRHATAERLKVDRYVASVVEQDGYRAALDYDLLFSCVDRPWPRRVLNHLAYAHLIPVIDGGILVRLRGQALIGADWHVRTVGPDRRCLECWKAFDPSLVGSEMAGKLDDPSYLAQFDPGHIFLRNENVFPFSLNVASMELLQLAAVVLGPVYNLGDQNYHYTTGTLDRSDDNGCEDGCLYPPLLATGDTVTQPVGHDSARRSGDHLMGEHAKH